MKLLTVAKIMIQLVEYDDNWPILFQNESKHILSVVGIAIISIEHIGSTAVVGFMAKPVIDIAGALDDINSIASIIDSIEVIGYRYYGENGLPGRYYFVKQTSDMKYHLHVVQHESLYWKRYLAFRDVLRNSQTIRDDYARLKKKLTMQYTEDSNAYSVAKSSFIEQILSNINL